MKATKFSRFLSMFLALLMCVSMVEAPLADAAGWRTRGRKSQETVTETAQTEESTEETAEETAEETTEEASEETAEEPSEETAEEPAEAESPVSFMAEGLAEEESGEFSIGTFYLYEKNGKMVVNCADIYEEIPGKTLTNVPTGFTDNASETKQTKLKTFVDGQELSAGKYYVYKLGILKVEPYKVDGKNVVFYVAAGDNRQELVLNVQNEGAEIKMPYREDGSSDYAKLADLIWEAVVAEGTTVQRGMVEFTYKYTDTLGVSEFVPFGGSGIRPAIDKGSFGSNKKAERTIKISFPGNEEYKPVEATVTISLAPDLRVTPVLSVNGPVTVEKSYTDNGVDYDAMRDAIVAAVTSDIEGLVLTTANCELNYLDKLNVAHPFEGGNTALVPSIDKVDADTVTVRVSFGGNDEYKPAKIDVQVVLTEPQRQESTLVLNQDGPAVAIPYTEIGVDAAALKSALWNALYVSSNPEMTCDDVAVTFHTAVGNQYVELNALSGFAIESYDAVKFTFAGNSDFLGCEATAPVSFVKSSVEYVEGQSITYNWDVSVMEAELMKIVAETSVLPEGSLSFEYKIGLDALKNLGIDTSKIPGLDSVGYWAPIGGGEVQGVGLIPRMGAGTHQVRVRTSGMVGSLLSKDQGVAVVVGKANCKVSVRSASTYADLGAPADMIAVTPAEETELPVITIYAGATSDIAVATYIDLSMNSKLYNGLKELLGDKLQDGITPQELVDFLNKYIAPDKALDVLKVFGVDTTILQKLVDVIQGLPTLGGRNRIAFGTPSRAGLYSVTAIAGSMNYNYAVGTGTLLLRARTQGVKLSWNQSVPKTVALADLGSYDFGASVLFNGVKVEKNANVVIRFTGLTKSFKLYSSHNAPKEPGTYVVTATTIGGNYLTTPITRTLKIK